MKAGSSTLPSWMQSEKLQLFLCFVGVVGSLLIYGVLQVSRGRACGPERGVSLLEEGQLCGATPLGAHFPT